MNWKILLSGFGAFIFLFGGMAKADIVLFDWGFNLDGGITLAGDPIPAGVDVSGFDFGTGLGSIGFAISGAGTHWVDLFLDHEMSEATNTFFNEFGVGGGDTLAAGQSAEIDEPGYLFGDIFDNFLASAFDGTTGVPPGLEDDVSMGMGWDFVLAAGESATITFLLAEMAPASGFFLNHVDPDSAELIFMSSVLGITGGGTPVPEPGTLWLLGVGLLGLGISRRRKLTCS